MARTAEGVTATINHRRMQIALRAGILRQLVTLWPVFDTEDFGTYRAFVEAVLPLIQRYHQDSAQLAARYYTAFRLVEGVAGTATPRLAAEMPFRQIRIALSATGLSSTLKAVRAGRSLESAKRAGFVAVSGSVGRLALAGGRDTVTSSIRADRQALGWQRVTDVDPCYFCAMLAGRGAVYVSRETAGFKAHDDGACVPEPFYRGSATISRNKEFERLWAESTHGKSDKAAVKAFRQAYEGR